MDDRVKRGASHVKMDFQEKWGETERQTDRENGVKALFHDIMAEKNTRIDERCQ